MYQSNKSGPPWHSPIWHVLRSGTLSHEGSSGVIVSFRDAWLRRFFVDDVRSKSIPPDLEASLFRRLQLIDDAAADEDLRVPPGNHFEKLRGRLDQFHSIRVNKQWRLIFQWNGSRGETTGVYLDAHRYL